MSDMIPLSIPEISGNEWKYVKECLDTNWVSSAGKYVDLFEKSICDFTGARFAIACVNGTAALHISLLLSNVKSGDEVIVPTLTFIAPVNAVKYCGAEPVFMDCDNHYNIDSEKTIEFLKHETEMYEGKCINKSSGKTISAIIPVHVFGNAVWLDDLIFECEKRNISVVEDATESLGTRYVKGKYTGKATGSIGEFGCFSFNGNKIITTGGGGMIITDSEEKSKKAKYLTTQAKEDEVRYIHNDIGYNYRMTNIQAALGVAQMEKLNEYLRIKHVNYEVYKNALDETEGIHIASTPSYSKNNNWMYALQIDKEKFGSSREEVMESLNKEGIQSRPVWYLNHLQKPFKENFSYKIEKAIKLHAVTLNIPCSVSLRESERNKVINSIINIHSLHLS
ncbi:LegC family aminotransferase [soil metagenome]